MPQRRKKAKFFLLSAVCFLLVGCTGKTEDAVSPKKEDVILSVCIAEEQWNDAIGGVTRLYLKEHPEISDIQWTLVSKSTYWDLMKMKLATGKLAAVTQFHRHFMEEEFFIIQSFCLKPDGTGFRRHIQSFALCVKHWRKRGLIHL